MNKKVRQEIQPLENVVKASGTLQIFELKQMADMEAIYKQQCLKALCGYKKWRRSYDQETDIIEILYGNLEGIMLRRHAEDCVRLYWTVRNDFRRLFHAYLEQTQCYSAVTNQKNKAA